MFLTKSIQLVIQIIRKKYIDYRKITQIKNELLTQATEKVKTIKKSFTFLITPEKNNAKSNPKIIENPIINASSKLTED